MNATIRVEKIGIESLDPALHLLGRFFDEEGFSTPADEMRASLLALFVAPAQSFVRLVAAAPTNFLYVLRARERSLSEGE